MTKNINFVYYLIVIIVDRLIIFYKYSIRTKEKTSYYINNELLHSLGILVKKKLQNEENKSLIFSNYSYFLVAIFDSFISRFI